MPHLAQDFSSSASFKPTSIGPSTWDDDYSRDDDFWSDIDDKTDSRNNDDDDDWRSPGINPAILIPAIVIPTIL